MSLKKRNQSPARVHHAASHSPVDSAGAINVVVRIRPPPTEGLSDKRPRENRGGEIYRNNGSLAWKWKENTILFQDPPERGGYEQRAHEYQFGSIFTMHVKTREVYQQVAQPLVQKCFEGYNGCIFAYGQTNSGKTWTIAGTQESPGIITLAVLDFFDHIKRTDGRISLLRVAFLEIYNEQLKDLLQDAQPNLIIQDDPARGPAVVNLSEHVVSSLDQVLSLVELGEKRRMFGRNNVHEHASRSHTIFQLIFESRSTAEEQVRVSALSIVDLAGSELTFQASEPIYSANAVEHRKEQQTIAAQAANTQDKRTQQMRPLREREGANIRKSLLALTRVVDVLARGNPGDHVPYRDSKLTRILRGALGGNTSTTVISTINPWMSATDDKETNATLRFAATAQRIHNQPRKVAAIGATALLQRYQDELKDLRTQMLIQNEKLETEKESLATENEVIGEALSSKAKQADRLKQQYESLAKFLLTSEGTNRDARNQQAKNKVLAKTGRRNVVANERTARRHSFTCLRDDSSMQLFVHNDQRKKVIESKGWGFAQQTSTVTAEQFKDAMHTSMKRKIAELEKKIADSKKECDKEKKRLAKDWEHQNEALRTENNGLIQQLNTLNTQHDNAQRQLAALSGSMQGENAAWANEKARLEAENEALQQTNNQLQSQLQRLDGVVTDHTGKMADINNETLRRNEELTLLQANNGSLHEMNASLKSSVNKLSTRCKEQEIIIRELNQRLGTVDLQGDKLSKEKRQTDEALAQERRRQEALEQQLQGQSQALKELTERLTDAHTQLEGTRRKLMQQEADHMAKTVALDQSEEGKRKLQEREAALANDLASKTKALTTYSSKLSATESELTDTRRELMQKCAELQDKADALEEYGGMLGIVERDLSKLTTHLEFTDHDLATKEIDLKGKEAENAKLFEDYCNTLRERMGFQGYYDSKLRNKLRKMLKRPEKKSWEKYAPQQKEISLKVERELQSQRTKVQAQAVEDVKQQFASRGDVKDQLKTLATTINQQQQQFTSASNSCASGPTSTGGKNAHRPTSSPPPNTELIPHPHITTPTTATTSEGVGSPHSGSGSGGSGGRMNEEERFVLTPRGGGAAPADPTTDKKTKDRDSGITVNSVSGNPVHFPKGSNLLETDSISSSPMLNSTNKTNETMPTPSTAENFAHSTQSATPKRVMVAGTGAGSTMLVTNTKDNQQVRHVTPTKGNPDKSADLSSPSAQFDLPSNTSTDSAAASRSVNIGTPTPNSQAPQPIPQTRNSQPHAVLAVSSKAPQGVSSPTSSNISADSSLNTSTTTVASSYLDTSNTNVPYNSTMLSSSSSTSMSDVSSRDTSPMHQRRAVGNSDVLSSPRSNPHSAANSPSYVHSNRSHYTNTPPPQQHHNHTSGIHRNVPSPHHNHHDYAYSTKNTTPRQGYSSSSPSYGSSYNGPQGQGFSRLPPPQYASTTTYVPPPPPAHPAAYDPYDMTPIPPPSSTRNRTEIVEFY